MIEHGERCDRFPSMFKKYCTHCQEETRRNEQTTCTCCQHRFGAWRPRCPACGTANDHANAKPVPMQPPPRTPRERKRHPTQCVFCQRRGSRDRCAKCKGPVHHTCKRVHEERCTGAQS